MKLDSSISAVITGGASGLGAATARRLAPSTPPMHLRIGAQPRKSVPARPGHLPGERPGARGQIRNVEVSWPTFLWGWRRGYE